MSLMNQSTTVGIAGVNTLQLAQSVLGVAGNLSTTLRPRIKRVLEERPDPASGDGKRNSLGDRAARVGWERVCYMQDYTYITCPDPHRGGMQWANGFEAFFSREHRTLPLVLDSAGYREHVRDSWVPVPGKKRPGAPMWASYQRYCEAIQLMLPDAYMSKDTIGSQDKSLAGYQRMLADGFDPIPVWQVGEAYEEALSPTENGKIAGRDPVLRWYAERAPMVAIGGMVKGVVPRSGRGAYLAGIAEALPGVRLWALGQASGTVVNQLGERGLLDRVSVDGSWWVHSAVTEQIATLGPDGMIGQISLARTGHHSFFPFRHLMAANLATLRAAFSGLWDFPGPSRVPTNMSDPDERFELKRRFVEQLNLFGEVA